MNTIEQIDYLREQLGIRDSQVLNDLLNSYSNAQISLQNQLVKQQHRIDRAIEYIKNKARNNCWIDQYESCELIDILRGENNE